MIFRETTNIIRELYGHASDHIRIEKIVLGLFFGGVKLSDGSGGISYMPVRDIHNDGGPETPSLTKPGPGTFGGVPASYILSIKNISVLFRTAQPVLQ